MPGPQNPQNISRRLLKRLSMKVMRLKERSPTAKVELWCTDEQRLGLKPIIRKVWSPIGQRPSVKVHQRYQWTYLYAFACPKSGDLHWLVLPTVNAELFSVALENFAEEVGAGTRKRILLVLDRAGWHTAKKLKVPEGIHLEFLPSHSPELQPSERLWPLSNEGVANRHFEEIEELEEALVDRCVALSDQPELIRSYIRYRWWPNAA
jgi:transposase